MKDSVSSTSSKSPSYFCTPHGISGVSSLSSEQLHPRIPEFSEHQNHLSQVLFQTPVQDLYQRLCTADVEKKDWAFLLLGEYAEIPGVNAFIRFALGPHRNGFFYFDCDPDELIAYLKEGYDATESFRSYAVVSALNLYYDGVDIRPFIQVLEEMSSLRKLTLYFEHLPLLNHFHSEQLIFSEKFSAIEHICFSNDLTAKQMLNALTLFSQARIVNVSASRQAFHLLTQEDIDQLRATISPKLEKLVIPHDVPLPVLKMLVDAGFRAVIVDLERKRYYQDLKV